MQKEWQWCADKYPKLKRDIGEKKSQQIWNLEEAAKQNQTKSGRSCQRQPLRIYIISGSQKLGEWWRAQKAPRFKSN